MNMGQNLNCPHPTLCTGWPSCICGRQNNSLYAPATSPPPDLVREVVKEVAEMGRKLGAAQAEIDKLTKALRDIQRYNDNPSRYDRHIDQMCEDAVGRPEKKSPR